MNAVKTTEKTYETYLSEWSRIDTTAGWAKGDLLVEMTADAKYGDGAMDALAKDTGTSKTTLYNYRDVARTFPRDSRRPEISWSVYVELLPLSEGDREKILNELQHKLPVGKTVRAVRKMISQQKAASTRARNQRAEKIGNFITNEVNAAGGLSNAELMKKLEAHGYLADDSDKPLISNQIGFQVQQGRIRKDGDRLSPPKPEVIAGPPKEKLTPSKVQEILAKVPAQHEKPQEEKPEEWIDHREYPAGDATVGEAIVIIERGEKTSKRALSVLFPDKHTFEVVFTPENWTAFINAEYARLNHPSNQPVGVEPDRDNLAGATAE
jgi:hypothetical protein